FAPGLEYPPLGPGELFEVVCSDWLFRMPSLHLAEAHVAGGGRAFVYEVTWEPPGPFGACHGMDVPLVFGNEGRGQSSAVLGEITADTHDLAAQMRTAWSSFAVSGDPGWPAYTAGERLTRIFDVPPSVVPYPEETSRLLWSGHRFEPLRLLE
ncbi:carboxylesterase family protein, partial [Lentzea sp. NPDC060358]|uniref:carboxylesterase family protein n=1 Tax=Lentzea sp. NPDC060358 TaxID=3347103 RepID=UPI00365584CD